MLSQNPIKRDLDQFVIPEGYYQEPYVPAVGKITSTKLGMKLAYAKFMLSADADVTWKDSKGNSVGPFALSKGPQIFLVSEISVVSGGASVVIIHDGQIDTSDAASSNFTG